MAADVSALREQVTQTQADLDDLRAQYQAEPTEALGRQLFDARQKASAALLALWEEVPEEKPPTQSLGM